MVALVAILCTLIAWLASRRTPGSPRWVRLLALGVFLGTLAQAPLGGITVIFDLHPLLVMAHFLLALVVLGLAVVVAVEAWSARAAAAIRSSRAGGVSSRSSAWSRASSSS